MKLIFNKWVLLILGVAFIFIFLFIIIGQENKRLIEPRISPTPVSDTSSPLRRFPMSVVKTNLENRPIGVHEGFTIEFSETPSTSEFFYEVLPETNLNLILKGRSLRVFPSPEWKANTNYSFVIKKGSKDLNGATLQSDYRIQFRTGPEEGIY